MHKMNAANEELVSRLKYGCKAQGVSRYTDCSYHSNSLSNKMDNSLLAVRGINHKYIVVGVREKYLCVGLPDWKRVHKRVPGAV